MIRAALAHEPLRYLLSAGICALSSNLVLIGGDQLGIGWGTLVLIAWALTGTLAYGLHAHFTFRHARSFGAYARFMAGAALGIPAAMGFIALMRGWLGWPMLVAAPVSTVAMFFYNYAVARVAILRRLWG